MKILIVAATNLEITSDKIKEKPILITGVGMINTAIKLTQELIKEKYDLVINMGVAGSFSDEIKNGDVVEVLEDNFSEIGFESDSEFLRFVDFNLKTRYQNKSRTHLKKVKAITVNTVHGSVMSISKIEKRENPEIETMEGASVFKVCTEMGISCIQIRSISNKIEKRNKNNWNLDLAISNLNIEVEKVIDNL